MSSIIRFKRGTKAAIDSVAAKGGLLSGEPLYFTDLATVGIATSTSTYDLMTKGHWACKYGPTSWNSAHKVNLAGGRGYGNSVDFTSNSTGLIINLTGQYEVRAVQRGTGSGNPYIALAINGDRSTLENRTSGVFTHDHTIDANQYSESTYIGLLNAGELITFGAVNSTEASFFTYGSQSIFGSLIIKRLT